MSPGREGRRGRDSLGDPVGLNAELAELALLRRGARTFHVTVVSPPQTAPVPVCSTGASPALQGLDPAVKALSASAFVVDLTVKGMLHAPELPDIIARGARLLMVSNKHPDALERLVPDTALTERVEAAVKRIRAANKMRVTSDTRTDLAVALEGAVKPATRSVHATENDVPARWTESKCRPVSCSRPAKSLSLTLPEAGLLATPNSWTFSLRGMAAALTIRPASSNAGSRSVGSPAEYKSLLTRPG